MEILIFLILVIEPIQAMEAELPVICKHLLKTLSGNILKIK